MTIHSTSADCAIDRVGAMTASHVSFLDFMTAGCGQFLLLPIKRWPWGGATQALDWAIPPWDPRMTGGPTNLHMVVACLLWLTRQKAEWLPEVGNTKTGLKFPDTRETNSPFAAQRARVDEVLGVISGVIGEGMSMVNRQLDVPSPTGVLTALGLAREQLRKLKEIARNKQVRRPGRPSKDHSDLRDWIRSRTFIVHNKGKRALVKIIAEQLVAQKPQKVPKTGWCTIERVMRGCSVDWSGVPPRQAVVSWPQ